MVFRNREFVERSFIILMVDLGVIQLSETGAERQGCQGTEKSGEQGYSRRK